MNDKITTYITNELIGKPDFKLDKQEDLLGSNLVDSLGLMRLIAFIEKEFDFKVPPTDMVIENFINVEAIGSYVAEIKEG